MCRSCTAFGTCFDGESESCEDAFGLDIRAGQLRLGVVKYREPGGWDMELNRQDNSFAGVHGVGGSRNQTGASVLGHSGEGSPLSRCRTLRGSHCPLVD